MPSLGADMDAGTVTHWLVKPGDEVHRGDIVAVVQTDKSDIEVEIFENGTIDELIVPEGERVPVGAVLARVRGVTSAGARPREPEPRPAAAVAVAPPTSPPTPIHHALVESPLVRHLAEHLGVDIATVSGSGLGGVVTRADVEHAAKAGADRAVPPSGAARRPPSSPYARRLAHELGVDLDAVSGTGPGGSVVEQDVRRAIPAAVPTQRPTSEDRQHAMQRTIGALMARSKREVPHYYLDTTIDLSAAAAWLERTNLERPVAQRLVMAALLFKATARAVARVPEMNGFYVDGTFTPSESVHLGIAISQRAGGLIAPAIHDAEQQSLDEMMNRVKDLVMRARTGVLRSSEMSDPTITVTSLGDLGVDSVLGVIYPPQVAMVGFGRVRERPWAQAGQLDVRPCVVATLSGDHRVSDGMRGSHFLTEIDHLLQEPEKL